ncbi:MAG: ATP-binding protein [Planctomycetes bacterium]|nr:ATP-binding protein [Planctomycetota bacterium]
MARADRRQEELARAYLVEEVRSSLRHALRNRLSVLRSAAYYLRRKVSATPLAAEDPNVPKFFELIDREVTAACELLGTSELEDERPAGAVDPAAAARSALERLEAPRAVVVALPSSDGVPPVATDADDLALALGYLLENAVQAVEARGGGEVRVEARPEADGHVAIAVTDEGGGLPDGVAGKLQEPFFTTKPGHQGLGLSIARRIAIRWGGTLEVASVPGGVQATLRLPAAGRRANP